MLKLRRNDREVFGLGAWTFALLAVLLAFGAMAVAASAKTTSNDAKQVAALGGSGTKVTLAEFSIDPTAITAAVNSTITVTNDGTVDHNFAIKDTSVRTKTLRGGESASVSLHGIKAGSYTVICEIPGHADSGMQATLTVGASAGSGTSGDANVALKSADAANSKSMEQQIVDYTAQLDKGMNTKGVGNQPLAPDVQPDGTKQFSLTTKIVDWQVEPGKTVKAWTYNGQVPGPMIKVADGDKVTSSSRTNFRNPRACTSTGSTRPTPWTASPTSPRTRFAPAARSRTSSPRTVPRWACITRTPTPWARSPTVWPAPSSSVTNRSRVAPRP